MGEMSREFGPFRIVRRLGVGGMAETFEVLRRGPGGFAQRCCLKRVLPAFEREPGFFEAFLHEARLGATLRHSNIVSVLDYGEHEGTPYLAMELIEGVDLRATLASVEGGRLRPEVVVWLGIEIARALAHAHAPPGTPAPTGVVHRDVSPSNVLITRAGEVKLADFGVAKAMVGPCATATEAVKGKVPYMAPEQMRGGAVDGRADLFSLGVLLFEALSGSRPFDGAHEVETMGRVLAGERVGLGAVAPDAPARLIATIERLLEVDPEARFPDAESVMRELAPLWPGPRVGREVGAWVEGLLGGAESRDHVQARLELERDTTLGQPLSFDAPDSIRAPRGRPSTALEEATTERAGATTDVASAGARRAEAAHDAGRSGARRRALGISAAIVAALALSAAAWRSEPRAPEPGDSAPASAAPAEARSPASDVPAPAVEPAAAPPVASDPTPTTDASAARAVAAPSTAADVAPSPPEAPASVRVAVIPWGNVWVDDRFMGRAPTTVSLRPGVHRIAAGFDAPSLTRRVRARSGRRHRLELVLPEPSREVP